VKKQVSARNKIIYTAGWVSIFLNILLFIVKYIAGVLSGSLALIADAWHTLSDSISSLVVIIGTKLSSKTADEKHPYGHGRFEIIAAFVVGMLLGYVGIEFIIHSVEKLQAREFVEYTDFALFAVILSIVAKEAMAQYAFWAYRKTANKALKADAWHHRTDAISSVLILIGIFFSASYWWIDAVLGILISLLILYTAWDIIKDAVSNLLGEKPDEESLEKIRIIINEIAGKEVNAHHFQLHNYGKHKELSFHIYLDGKMSVKQAHDIATDIEKEIEKQCDMQTTIHIEPQKEP
jgi:cation diffusion facilitator family transporter